MHMRLRIISPEGETTERIVTAPVVRLGRDPACEVDFDAAMYPKVSGEHARIERTAAGLVLTPRSRSNKTLLNDQPVEVPAALKVGDRIRLGYSGPTVEILGTDAPRSKPVPPVKPAAPVEPATPAEGTGATIQAGPQHLNLLRGSLAAQRFEIGSGGIIGRDKGAVQFPLDHPHVSRQHARLTVNGGRVVLIDLGSANGTHVNGRRIAKPVALSHGDRIDIGPFSLQFDGEALVSRSRSNNIELMGHKLRRVVKDRATGNPLTLLHDISLVVRPREFVCLLGPSGSGKSTLLAMLSGRNPPDRGAVTVNGEDLYANFAALKQDIAVVPQKDVLHDSLAVGPALRYTAELRLPPDTGRDEMESSVTDILEVVGLGKRRATLIRHLSGGQVKRASLANELMARPSLLFVDEATSGLDEQTDREIMELFRQVADSGKTVVCITHNLANVEATCHLVVILTEGGRLAFIGTPDEAKSYFDVARLGDVYRKLGERAAEDWQTAFKTSPFYSRYVRDRMSLDEDSRDKEREEQEPHEHTAANLFRQTWTLTRRYVDVWRGDRQALLAMLGQSLLVALLLGIVFGRLDAVKDSMERARRTVNLLFLLNVSCFWFGCNNAAKELVKERLICTRERDFNLRIDSYFASKFLVLVLIALIQIALLFGIVRLWCGPPGSAMWQLVALAALATAGTLLGLLISALARTEEVAVALVPIAIIPQIILAGVIAPLSGLGKLLAEIAITTHWGERALEALLPEGDLALLPLKQGEYRWQVAIVAAHVLAFAAATLLALWWQGRIRRSV
jgi:ABC-type multidrug transport system ATPase subunit/ABC-type multidrug transport system permease subunit